MASTICRRSFLAVSALGSLGVGRAAALSTIGVQLYTVRRQLPEKPLETLQALEKIGYQEVEVVGATLDAIWSSLRKTSLKPASVHLDTSLFTTNQDKLPAEIEKAHKLGFRYVVCPYIAPKDRGGAEVMQRLAAVLNQAGEKCRANGLQLCYHNHAFEFEPAGRGTLLDVLMENTDPKLVGLELDIMWAQVAGASPVRVLEKYGCRTPLLHLKDVASSSGPQYHERLPQTAFREVGNGVIDIPAVLRAAVKAGVQHYFVEQDQTPGDPLESLRQSYNYLRKLRF